MDVDIMAVQSISAIYWSQKLNINDAKLGMLKSKWPGLLDCNPTRYGGLHNLARVLRKSIWIT